MTAQVLRIFQWRTALIRWIFHAARWSALLGGVVLCAITLMSVTSIAGRALVPLGLGPVPGDFELVEVGTAVAVFFFLPWCHVQAGHATVDLLAGAMSQPLKSAIQTLCDVLMLLLWLVLAWKMGDGMLEKREQMETSFILQMPVWWAYAICLVGAVIGCLTYVAKAAIQLGLARWPHGFERAANGGH